MQHIDLEAFNIKLDPGYSAVPDDRVDRYHRNLSNTVRIQAIHAVLAAGEPGGARTNPSRGTNRLDGVAIKRDVLLKQRERILGGLESYDFCAKILRPR